MERNAMIVAGFGFRASANTASLADALAQTGWTGMIDALATAADKTDARCLRDFAAGRAVIVGVDAVALAAAPVRTHSSRSLQQRGTGSLCEAAALAAAGPGARLIATRCISDDRLATCAIAEGPKP